MSLRSGKVTTINEDRQRGRYTRGMENLNQPNSANPQNMSTNSRELPPVPSTGGPTLLATVSEPITLMASLMPTHSIAHTEHILNFTGPRGPPQTPPPIGTSVFRTFMPHGF